jgi:phospholipid transport system substrate-binding protein
MNNIRTTVIVIVFWSLALSAANGGEPIELVKSVHDRMVQLLEDPTLQSKDKDTELNDRLRDVIMPVTDVDEMAKRALIKHWNHLTTAEKAEFVELFRTYLSLADRGPRRFTSRTLVLEREKIQDEFAEVAGYYYFPAGRNGPVNFYLHLVDGKWMLYDSSAWGVVGLDNFRAQCDRVIAKSSFKGLLNLLREKIELMKKWRSR